jgi:hypothetical protein
MKLSAIVALALTGLAVAVPVAEPAAEPADLAKREWFSRTMKKERQKLQLPVDSKYANSCRSI